MKRFAVCLSALLMLTAVPAFAVDWQPVATSGEKDYVLFVDRETLQRAGGNVKAWFLLDFAETLVTSGGKMSFRSIAELNYLNCDDRSKASVEQRMYAGNMGRGEVVHEQVVKDAALMYTEIIPQSPGELKFDHVCAPGASALKRPGTRP